MDYFTDLLATFLDIDCVSYIAVYGWIRELSECIKSILICVPKTNGGLTGLEQHKGGRYQHFHFLVEYQFRLKS